MEPISLVPITEENFRAYTRLKTQPEQAEFVATNIHSIAQVYVNPTWQPLGIAAGKTAVGFVLTGREITTDYDWIIRFMIGAEHQGKGYGKAALLAVIAHLKATPGNREIRLSYVPGNLVAEGLYRSVGFVPTGEIDDGEIIMRLAE
jgi:diamine N-acetyltransferase